MIIITIVVIIITINIISIYGHILGYKGANGLGFRVHAGII